MISLAVPGIFGAGVGAVVGQQLNTVLAWVFSVGHGVLAKALALLLNFVLDYLPLSGVPGLSRMRWRNCRVPWRRL